MEWSWHCLWIGLIVWIVVWIIRNARFAQRVLSADLLPPGQEQKRGTPAAEFEISYYKGGDKTLSLSFKRPKVPVGTKVEVQIGRLSPIVFTTKYERPWFSLDSREGERIPEAESGDMVTVSIDSETILLGEIREVIYKPHKDRKSVLARPLDPEQRKKLAVRRGCMLVIPAVMFVAGIFLTHDAVTQTLRMYESPSWPTTTGTVLESETRWGTAEDPYFHIRYRFTVGENFYIGKRVSLSIAVRDDPELLRLKKRYPKGTEVSVSYMPGDPTLCVLEPGPVRRWWLYPCISTCYTLGVGLFLLLLLRVPATASPQRQTHE